jgi:hypothetical protein
LTEFPVDSAENLYLLLAAQNAKRFVSSGQNVELDLGAPHAALGEIHVLLVVDTPEKQDARDVVHNAFVVDWLFFCSADRLLQCQYMCSVQNQSRNLPV